ncbi:Integral membrane protein [Frankia canadensis]|uniref:Integral membrane protein n=1 Tax=Frankia canadensis TaxID=1836972 RepID=A0A2I2KWR0_9ACTN|nr:DUF3817 domain-containing protein [Frankia canadensis]SNQ50123.1 Integral membrane protein [Frankia canadensis]SOU57413.1 Integral membrane protein [Frankia canadensis]
MTAFPAPSHPSGARSSAPAIRSALLRYRVIAYVVGVGLILLVCIGMPLKYAGGQDVVVAAVGPIHGVLYIGYLLCTYDLATRCRIPLPKAVLIMLAGTIPFLSFVAERWVTGRVRGQLAGAQGAVASRPGAATGTAGATEAPAR